MLMLFTIQIGYGYKNEDDVKTIEVTYIANEGFLIKLNDKKILIDVLFGDRDYGFCDIPTKATINSILNNENNFRDIDLIVTTHSHPDHFYATFVIEHLMKNPKEKFISCKQTIDALKKIDNYEKVKNNLVSITPDLISYIDTTINGIGVRVYRLAHGPYYTDDPVSGEKINRHQNVQNLGFLFNVDGIKIFHSGDSDVNGIAEYEQFRLNKENIDIAFLGRGFIWNSDSKGISLVKNYINSKQIVLMHIHHNEYEEFQEVANQLRNEFESIKIFRSELETKTYVFK